VGRKEFFYTADFRNTRLSVLLSKLNETTSPTIVNLLHRLVGYSHGEIRGYRKISNFLSGVLIKIHRAKERLPTLDSLGSELNQLVRASLCF
jgi:hypothetical protein